jgi:Na+/proline symporter
MTVTAGLYARAALPGLREPVMAYPALAEAVLPPVAKGIFVAGLLATIMSTLNSLAFISAASFGRDILWRLMGSPEGGAEVRLTRFGLAAATAVALALAIVVPSVIDLWYVLGTAVIPGLLVPLVSSYFERWKPSPGFAVCAMGAGWGVSMSWLVAGMVLRDGNPGYPVLGVEPMFPGLAVSILIWALGLRVRKRVAMP